MMNETKLELYDEVDTFVEGEMAVNRNTNKSPPVLGSPEFNTLDEPIKDTILRDLRAVTVKFFHVLFPREKKTLIKEWDLWGPLMLCTFLAMMLQGSTSADHPEEGGPAFAGVFLIVWIGSVVVTLNAKLLGGKISIFQSICVLGYCLLAPVVTLIICRFIEIFEQTKFLFFLRFTFTLTGFVWATYASTVFLGDTQKPERKALAVYPIGLFYFIISLLILAHNHS